MSYPVYYPVAGDTLVHLFDTFDGGTGASITMTGLAVTDIEIYKDGGTTQRSSDAGYTLLDTDGIDFDSLTGIHGFSIDLSDNTDSGFFEVGPWYHVVVSSITVDSQTVSFVACAFRILSATRGMTGTALPDAAADAAGGLPISDAGALDLDAMNANVSTAIAGVVTGTAQAGAAGTITLAAGASATNDIFNGMTVVTTGGTGPGQSRQVYDYDGSTKVASVSPNWQTNPSSDTTYAVVPTPPAPTAAAAVPQVALVDDAITAGKYDESTAFPVVAADTGATQIARVGSDSDTLETLSDEVAALATTVGVAGAGLTAVAWNSAWDAEVQSEVQDAIEANHLDHLLAATYDPASKPGAADALLNEIVENDSGVSRFTVNALENAPSGSGASAETIADAVWDEAASGHVGAGTFGKLAADVLEDTGTTLPTTLGTPADTDLATDIANFVTTVGTPADTDLSTDIANLAAGVTLADGAHGGSSAVLTLKQLAVSNGDAGAPAVTIAGTGTGNSHGVLINSTNAKALALGSTNSDAVSIDAPSGDPVTYESVELITAIVGGVLDEATSGHTTAGTVSKAVIDILAVTDALTAAGAAKIAATTAGVITGAAATGTLNTTTATTNLTGYAADQLIGRILTVTSGNAEGEQTDITDYSDTNGTLTFTALTTAMGNGDTFVIT